jgi:septum formation protein
MLQQLSGRDHQVMTGVTVICGNHAKTFTEVTDIHFRALSEKEIRAYVATGEPMDKAGAYGIQGGAALFCTHMVGDYYNVMGLPVCRLGQVLREMAPELMGDML